MDDPGGFEMRMPGFKSGSRLPGSSEQLRLRVKICLWQYVRFNQPIRGTAFHPADNRFREAHGEEMRGVRLPSIALGTSRPHPAQESSLTRA
jgi:hypothetical protein